MKGIAGYGCSLSVFHSLFIFSGIFSMRFSSSLPDVRYFKEKKAKVVIDEDGFAVPTSLKVPKKVGSGAGAAVASTEAPSSSGNVNGSENSAKTVFISNLDFKLPKEKIMQIFPNAKEVRFIQRGMSKLHKVC